ncbi:Hypothetical predicted protein, partial [Pelobates cultripes]
MTWSDHAPVRTTFQTLHPAQGRGLWRLNESALRNEEMSKLIAKALSDYFSDNTQQDVRTSTTWLAHKVVIRGLFIQIGARARSKIGVDTSIIERQIG